MGYFMPDAMGYGSGQIEKLPARRRRHRRRHHLILPGGAGATPDPHLSRPIGLHDSLTGSIECLPGWLSGLLV